MTTADIRLISVVVTLFVIVMDEVEKSLKEIRLEISEYRVLMKAGRYTTAASVVRRIYELADRMFQVAKEKDSE